MASLTGPEHRFEFVNLAYRQLVGERDVLGLPIREALPEIVAQGFVALLDEVRATGRPYRANAAPVVLARHTGQALEERTLDFVYQPTPGPDGTIQGVLAIGVDVTERVLAERALVFREEQVRLAAEAGEVGFWDVDPIAGTLYWPPNVRAMFGIFSDEPVTVEHDFARALHPDDQAATFASYQRAIDPAVRALYDVEYRSIGRDDGVLRWVAAKGRGLFDAAGRCVRVLGTAMDITARKRDEERLRELNETLGQRLEDHPAERKLLVDVVEGTDALIQVVDRQFTVLASNRGNVEEFASIYGVKPRIGDNLLALLAHLPAAREEAQRVWSRALAGETFVEEAQFGDPQLSRRWYELHFQPLYSARDELIGAFQFGYDVTARRQAEARLAEAEQALQQAQRMESIGLLTGGVAHDFNNVLQALNAKFELMRRRADDADSVRSWAASGIELTRKAARVTAQLLAFSRRQTAGAQHVHLGQLLENMLDLLRTTLGPSVRLHTASDDVWVNAESTQLEMALLNLAVNARDAMPSGGTVQVAGRAVDADWVELSVADTGTGMDQALIAKAFTPFFTTKALGKGSGLGLAQVYAMATRAGGDVRIESDGVSGTRVVIRLPRAQADQAATAALPPGPALAAFEPTAMLVVDDDAAVRGPLVELLRGLGHRVAEADGGEQALALLERAPVDMLLTDFAMPGMSGVALANLARAGDPSLQVIFMSGYADGDELRDAIGQQGLLLRKPFDIDAVERAIAQAQRRRHRPGA